MKVTKKTVFLTVGGLMVLIGFIQLRTPHYVKDEGGMFVLLLAGAVIALFGAKRGPAGAIRDEFDGWGKSLPEQIGSVEFHGTTFVDGDGMIAAARKTAATLSEASSNFRVEDVHTDGLRMSIRGPGGIVTQMSFAISWRTDNDGSSRIDISVGQYLTKQSTIYGFIPTGRKRVIALPAMRRFRDSYVRELGASQTTPGSPAIAGSQTAWDLLQEKEGGAQCDDSIGFPPSPEHVPSAHEASAEATSQESFEPSLPAPERYESGEPTLDSHKVEDYFAHTSGQKPPRSREPKPAFNFSTMSRRTIGITAGTSAFAVLILGIFLGANSGRLSAQDSVPAATPVSQPTVTSTDQASLEPPAPATVVAAPPSAQPAPPSPTQPGDLGLTSPLRPVDCTGKFAVFYHSSITPSAYSQDVQANLASHPGSKYLLTLGSCSSLYQMSNKGTMIYAVYGGPFDTLAQACVAASRFPDEAYVKVLDNSTPPDQAVRSCS
ncbi:hypothetical protein [Arthrobacter sp. TE12232]